MKKLLRSMLAVPGATTAKPRGVALVLVLSFLVIISGLVIAFFSMVTTEASSAGTTAAASSAKTLADSAVSYVMGTIVDATLGRDPASDPSLGGPQYAWVWASQPGMIRTYDNTGLPRFVYKLYSADNMKISGNASPATDTNGLSKWATGAMRDVWVDMNEPIKVSNGAGTISDGASGTTNAVDDVYPIVDPRAAEDYTSTGFAGHDETTVASAHKVAGFKVLKATGGDVVDINAPLYDSNNNNPAPMPVKWLYVLQDGTLTTATFSGTDATLNGSAATASNPIKGRIAFWTDDESCKVNINTASQGSYWDTPRVNSEADGGRLTTVSISASGPQSNPAYPGLSVNQPAKGEFQRYAGHPASVSLSEIFGYRGTKGTLNPVLPVPVPALNYTYNSTDVQQIEKYYTLTPRVLPGGSRAGTAIPPNTLPATRTDGTLDYTGQAAYYWRLYSSVDELLFNAIDPIQMSTPPPGSTGNSGDLIHRVPNLFNSVSYAPPSRPATTVRQSALTTEMMEKAKFFLTANSSGPEVTLYNTPRVSMWPVNDDTPGHFAPQRGPAFTLQLTAYDKLAQFCSTVGPVSRTGYPFYFRRFNSRSATADYLQEPRNPVLFQYLQALTSLPVPGASGNSTFAKKYPSPGAGTASAGASDCDQILACIFDYIRCTNMQDSTPSSDPQHNPAANPKDPLAYPYRYTPVSVVTGARSGQDTDETYVPGGGEVMPIRITKGTNTVQGFGRYDTIASAYLLFFPAHAFPWGGQPGNTTGSPKLYTPEPNGHLLMANGDVVDGGATDAMGVVFMLSFFNPMQGNVGNHQNMAYEVSGLDNLHFTSGPYVAVTPSPATAGNVPPATEWKGSPHAGGGVQIVPDSIPVTDPAARVFPHGKHYNIVQQGDVRTWHGRGIGGTAGPIMSFTNGLWGTEAADKHKDCISNNLTDTSGKATEPNFKVVHDNYPFYSYTNQLPIPPGNLGSNLREDARNVYYPTTFSIHQEMNVGNEDKYITVRTYPADFVGSSPRTEDAIQTFKLFFPDGRFRIPCAVTADNNYGKISTYGQNGFGGQSYPIYQLDGAGRNTAFLFNPRIEFREGGTNTTRYTYGTDNFVQPNDTVVSLEPAGKNGSDNTTVVDHTAGDQRMYGALRNVDPKYFRPNFWYSIGGTPGNPEVGVPQFAHNMMRSVSGSLVYYGVNRPVITNIGAGFSNYNKQYNLGKLINTASDYSRGPDVSRRVGPDANSGTGDNSYVTRADGGPGSWDTGMGLHKDGAYINKPEEGDQNFYRYDDNNPRYRIPYMDKEDYFTNSGTYFSPNRQIPSSMMLGSIPTGIQRFQPWQTLLFHPPLGDTTHPGSAIAPADHYMADLFWMPVVEPYAISQPFSTAGKINMNYQIQPFTYIRRPTAMRALMASMKIPAIYNTYVATYKPFDGNQGARIPDVRIPLNLDATATMLENRFLSNDIYRSATEIATVPLVPKDLAIFPNETFAGISSKLASYWGDGRGANTARQLTGNNLRDKPYADLYGRLTTKSNAFTVHVRAQSLRKANNTPVNHWVAGKDQVIAEYRGSAIVERYIDANDPLLPDFAQILATNPGATDSSLNIDQYYKFRVVSTKRFAP